MIQLTNVSFSFPHAAGSEALHSLNLTIQDGEWVSVTGANGSGKSVLCKLIAGLYKPSSGFVKIDGLHSHEVPRAADGSLLSGIAFQNPDSQFLTSTVEREIRFGMENMGLDEPETERRFRAAVEIFELGKYLQRNPHTLSGGEKQRLLLASIWTMRPKHFILDEPFSFLDAQSRKSFLDIVRSSFHRSGRTIVWITLELDEIRYADRVIYLEDGAITFDGPPERLAGSIPADILASSSFSVGTGISAGERPVEQPGCVLDIAHAVFSHQGGNFVLHVPDLSLGRGEFLGVKGPTGSGKTTLLLGCSGLLPPERGTVSILGQKIQSKRDFPAGRVAYLFQTPEEGFFAPTVREEVALGFRSFQKRNDEKKAVSDALEAVGLDPGKFIDRSPFHLSQGEKRLVAIASLIVLPAEFYLLDEPTLFLDGRAKRLLVSTIDRLQSSGMTTVLASHDPEFVRSFSSGIVSIDSGRIAPIPIS